MADPRHQVRERIGGTMGVGDASGSQLSHRVGCWMDRTALRPPRHHGGIRNQQRGDHRVGMVGERTVQPQQHGLPRTESAGTADLCVERRFQARVAQDQRDHAAGMLPAGFGGRLHRVVVAGFIGDDDQGEDKVHRTAADTAPFSSQRFGDLRGGCSRKIQGHNGPPQN